MGTSGVNKLKKADMRALQQQNDEISYYNSSQS